MRTCLALALLAACSIDAPGGFVSTGPGPYFKMSMFFNDEVESADASPDSPALIGAIRAAGGWGNDDRMRIDFSFSVLDVDATTSIRTFTPTADFLSPDCDHAAVPVPVRGNVEGESGYECRS